MEFGNIYKIENPIKKKLRVCEGIKVKLKD